MTIGNINFGNNTPGFLAGIPIIVRKRIRDFEKITLKQWEKDTSSLNVIDYKDILLPQRMTEGSAGYDFFSPMSFTLEPNQSIKIPTGIRAYMQKNEKLSIHTRSGNGFKFIRLSNGTGIVDFDFYMNEGNEGHIWVKLSNEGTSNFECKIEDGFAQGIFEPVLLTDTDSPKGKRIGGLGSTNQIRIS